jgi:hypothetical protein
MRLDEKDVGSLGAAELRYRARLAAAAAEGMSWPRLPPGACEACRTLQELLFAPDGQSVGASARLAIAVRCTCGSCSDSGYIDELSARANRH